MKRLFLMCIFCTMLFSTTAFAQETVTITIDDLRAFRKSAADAVFWENTSKDKDKQIEAVKKSAAEWQSIAKSETDRADRVQGGRVDELKGAVTDLTNAKQILQIQAIADRQKIGEQNEEIIGLKSSRKWYASAGAAAGGLVGFVVGRQTCGTSIPGLSFRAAELRPMPQQQPTFNDWLRQQK